MKYKITFETSSDRYSAERKYIMVDSENLASKIESLQARGRIIYSVSQAN